MEEKPNIQVSTIVPAYEAGKFLRRALDSALAQNVPGHEIIVVDDASPDDTCEVVAGYRDRVRLIRHDHRRGAGAARNSGIAAARGEYIAFLDADDEWLPNKLRNQLAVITANPAMTFVACRSNLIDELGHDTGDIYRGALPAVGREAWRTLLAYPCVATPSVLARRDAILQAGLFNNLLTVGEDQDMWIRLSLLGEVGYVPETFVRVHSVANSLSKKSAREQAGIVLPMVVAHMERNRDRLGRCEIRLILAERHGKVGRLAYAEGDLTYGLATLARAVAYGYRPISTMFYLFRPSGPLRWFKRHLGISQERHV